MRQNCFLSRLGLAASFLLLLAGDARAIGPVELSVSPVRFELAGYAGQVLRGTLGVSNSTKDLLPVTMEIEDFAPRGEEGQVAVGASADGTHSLKSWVRFGFGEFTVFPKERFPVDFTVEIPSGAPPGTYYGTILARTRSEPQMGPAVVTKVGALVLVDVYGEVREELSVAEMRTPHFAWSLPLDLTLRLANTGTVRERPEGNVSIVNMFGKTVATMALAGQNVLPGAIRRIEAPIREGPLAGRYTVRLEAKYGLRNQAPLSAEERFWFVDWRNVGLPALILGAVAAFVAVKRKNFRAAFRVLKTGEADRAADHKAERPAGEEPQAEQGRKPRKLDL